MGECMYIVHNLNSLRGNEMISWEFFSFLEKVKHSSHSSSAHSTSLTQLSLYTENYF